LLIVDSKPESAIHQQSPITNFKEPLPVLSKLDSARSLHHPECQIDLDFSLREKSSALASRARLAFCGAKKL
jgi:hypothetical protein